MIAGLTAQLVSQGVKNAPKFIRGSRKVIIPLGIAAVAAVGTGAKGRFDVKAARKMRSDAEVRLDEALRHLEVVREATEADARAYGEMQIRSHEATIGVFAEWLERNEKLVKRLNFKKVDGVRIRVPRIPKYVSNVDSVRTGIAGLASGLSASAAAPAGALWGISSFAAAGTGTAISSLSGAAATNATLAWLGGGTIAAGGGGVAAGAAVLGAVTVAPALIIGGITIGIDGARKKTSSRKYVALVETEIARIEVLEVLLGSISERIGELSIILERLTRGAAAALTTLEALEFDPDLHASEFLRALQFVTAVKDVVNTPIIDPKSGKLTDESVEIIERFK